MKDKIENQQPSIIADKKPLIKAQTKQPKSKPANAQTKRSLSKKGHDEEKKGELEKVEHVQKKSSLPLQEEEEKIAPKLPKKSDNAVYQSQISIDSKSS